MSIGKEIIGPMLGEVAQKDIETVNAIAEVLLASSNQREEVRLQSPEGQEIYGVAFRGSEGAEIIVTDEFLAIAYKTGKIDLFWPRKLE